MKVGNMFYTLIEQRGVIYFTMAGETYFTTAGETVKNAERYRIRGAGEITRGA